MPEYRATNQAEHYSNRLVLTKVGSIETLKKIKTQIIQLKVAWHIIWSILKGSNKSEHFTITDT